jgi:hypothetical protein
MIGFGLGAKPLPPRPCRPCRQADEDREVERKEGDGDPPQPCRHFSLEGEGGGDPVIADGEIAEAEQPAEAEGGAVGVGVFQQPEEDRQCDQRDRPSPERSEAGGARGTDEERGEAGTAEGGGGDCGQHWGAL